jgi:hypothetical protein
MLELTLLSSVVAVAALTAILLGAGRRPLTGGRWRALATVGVVISAGLGSLAAGSPVPLAVGTAIAVISVTAPRRWYAIGALFFASLVVVTAAYAAYLAQATLLLASDPLSLVLGLVLLALEFGAMGLILASAFEMGRDGARRGGPGAAGPRARSGGLRVGRPYPGRPPDLGARYLRLGDRVRPRRSDPCADRGGSPSEDGP